MSSGRGPRTWLPPKALVHQWAKHTGRSKTKAKSDLIRLYYEQHPQRAAK